MLREAGATPASPGRGEADPGTSPEDRLVLDRWPLRRRVRGDSSVRSRTLAAAAGGDLTDLARRVAGSLLGRCVQRFFAMRGIDQGMVLASQAFTALIPLLILFA